MAKRQKTTPFEDMAELVSLMPWSVGVILAVVSYLVLHAFASGPIQPLNMKDPGVSFAQMIGKILAMAGQYIVPAACLVGAVISAWRRRKRKNLVVNVVKGDEVDVLNGMTWQDFEITVGEAFRLDGFQVEERGGAGADGGIDLVLRRGNEKFLVQCKQWKARNVGVDIVRELYGVMAAERAAGGFVVTSGTFTPDARVFAQGREIVLVDGPILFDMIKHARRAPIANERPPSAPACPACGSVMVQRVAKKGANAGNAFWGCSTFPACKGTRDI